MTEPVSESRGDESAAAAVAVAAPAPAPAPPFGHAPSGGGGFDPKSHKVLVELGVIVAVLAALGALAVWGGGVIAAALTPILPVSIDRQLGSLGNSALAVAECPNPAAKKYVEELARPLLAAAAPLPFEFQFRVVDDASVNAYALPGGFVTVNRGLLEAAETGEEVAGVLGHEIQHALLRHGTRRILREMGGSFALALLFGGSDLQAYSQVASRLTGLRYDREQESEADREGVALLLRAHVDPSGLARFFARIEQEGPMPPELLSTHPDPGNRAAEIAKARLSGPGLALAKPKSVSCALAGK